MRGPKVHLAKPRGGASACGLSIPKRHTRIPEEVTCMKCRTTVVMADAVAATANIIPISRRARR